MILVGIDRDDTLVDDPGQLGSDPHWRRNLKFLPTVIDGLRLLTSQRNIRVVVATNQEVALGLVDEHRIKEVNAEISKRLTVRGIPRISFYYTPFVGCEYAVAHGISLPHQYVKETEDRKPGIGMLRRAAIDLDMTLERFKQIYFIGDKATDVLTGLNCGPKGRGLLVINQKRPKERDKTLDLRASGGYNDRVSLFSKFVDAADYIVDRC